MNSYGITSEYDKKFNSEVPKKQAKSYEIDLGQNNGPYKEDLLIRYGDHTVQQIMKSKNNMNMEDIMRMNDVLKPYQERTKETSGDNLNNQCDGIESMLGDIDDNANYLKEFEDNLTKAIELSTNETFKFFEDTYNEFNPELLVKYKILKSKIKDQKDENADLLKQIDLLNQEISTIFENIIKLGNRLDHLEKVSGVDKIEYDDDDYDDDDDIHS